MQKDWKAEYDKLQGEIKQLKDQVMRLRSAEESRMSKDSELRDKFKELLIEVLGR